MAGLLQTHARDVLAGASDALQSLAAAAARSAAHDAENLRLYIEEHGHPPPDVAS